MSIERYHFCSSPVLLSPDQFLASHARLFEVTRASVAELLPKARIEHVGASAITGAWSKGDLDICVVVAAADHAKAVSLLGSNGWQIKEDTLRSDQLCMLVSDEIEGLALQLVAADSKFMFFIIFRDLLNANPALVQRYNQIKQQHAHQSEEQYRAAKSAFIEEVLISQSNHIAPQ